MGRIGQVAWNKGFTVKTNNKLREMEENRRLSRVYTILPRIDIRCKECTKEFSDLVSSNRTFCSKTCATKWQHKNAQDKMFEWRKDKDRVKEAGRKISRSQKGVPKKDWVKKKISEGLKKRYIDRPELRLNIGKYWTGKKRPEHSLKMRGLNYIPSEYGETFTKELKKKIKVKYGWKCYLCNTHRSKTVLFVHHIDKNKANNNENNLISLCGSCHYKVHWHPEILEVIL